MKTAISIPDELFKEVNKLASQRKCSRSKVFAIAVGDFIKRQEAEKLLDALNEAYSDEETPEENVLRKEARRYYAKKLLKERY